MRLLRWLVMMLLGVAAAMPSGAQTPSVNAQHLRVQLVVPPRQLVQGAKLTAGLNFTIEKTWHIYWVNAGDSGEPPTAKWTLPAGMTAQPFLYPAPTRLPLGPLMDFGYERQVTFPVPMQVGSATPLGPATVRVHVDWLVCQNVCLPGSADLSVARPVVAAGTTATVDADAEGIVRAGLASLPKPLPTGDSAVFQAGPKDYELAVLTGSPVTSGEFFPLDQTVVANAAPEPAAPLAKGVRLTLARDLNQQGQLSGLRGVLELPGGTAYTVDARPGAIPPVVSAAATEPGSGAGLGKAALLGFLGGILLNLMPCVFPVLFLKGLSLVHSSREERQTRQAHGWVYTLGILISFWVVVGVLLVLRGAGHQLGWGFQFQSPVFLALLALFLFFLALSLAGQFEVGLSLTSAGGGLARKQGYAGSFFTGVLAMVVATPCTAPLMGVALGYGLAHGAAASFVVFTALGLGLAAPYLLLAYNPGWTRLLPRPGAWMETLKHLVAIPIFATVIWLVWLFTQSAGANALLGLLAGFLLLGVAGALLGRWPARRGATIAAVLVLALAVTAPLYAVHAFTEAGGDTAASAGPGNNWKPFTPGIAAEYQAQGRPVLVDFTAKWCLSCQVNERVVLDRPEVQKRLRQSGVVLVRADWTRHSAEIGSALAALGRSGIPLYALYPGVPGAAPTLLPEVLTPGVVYRALDSLKPDRATAAGE